MPKGATMGKPTNQGVTELKFQRSHQSVAEVSGSWFNARHVVRSGSCVGNDLLLASFGVEGYEL